eukprot:CAMPEP_0197428004 /NCGR_PEP_ID=MMETSP1170-20131217/39914_1 /TAXON_ID=54406 /ORGANISM="Sarcinochrysis sp, Strain CCMP770" /LENGTH=54 /DNA_ID=CAMNT_0042955725 /DNA_START=12 /DNA_END=173 /DNA_ORIENTATION=+
MTGGQKSNEDEETVGGGSALVAASIEVVARREGESRSVGCGVRDGDGGRARDSV